MNLLSVETRNEVCVVTPSGASLHSREVLDVLSGEAESIPVGSDVIVDLGKIRADYQEWVGTLITMYRRVTDAGYKLVAFGSSNGMADKLAVTRVDGLIKLVATEEDALAEVSV